jgi:hypothetical protein
MYTIILDNKENDKELTILLPIVPRIGDWIRLNDEDDFTDGESLLTVKRVILEASNEIIKVVVAYN